MYGMLIILSILTATFCSRSYHPRVIAICDQYCKDSMSSEAVNIYIALRTLSEILLPMPIEITRFIGKGGLARDTQSLTKCS
jgi:hypothetical protein